MVGNCDWADVGTVPERLTGRARLQGTRTDTRHIERRGGTTDTAAASHTWRGARVAQVSERSQPSITLTLPGRLISYRRQAHIHSSRGNITHQCLYPTHFLAAASPASIFRHSRNEGHLSQVLSVLRCQSLSIRAPRSIAQYTPTGLSGAWGLLTFF